MNFSNKVASKDSRISAKGFELGLSENIETKVVFTFNVIDLLSSKSMFRSSRKNKKEIQEQDIIKQ